MSASAKAFPMIWIPTGNLLPSELSSNPAGMVMAGKPVRGEKLNFPLLVASQKACMILMSIVTHLIGCVEVRPAKGGWLIKGMACCI